jgi:hypothetical protein
MDESTWKAQYASGRTMQQIMSGRDVQASSLVFVHIIQCNRQKHNDSSSCGFKCAKPGPWVSSSPT